MSKKAMKRKIKKIVDNPGVAIEKGVKKGVKTVKGLGKNEKIKKVIDDPGNAIETGIKKSWKITKSFGKGVKKGLRKEKDNET